VLSLRQNPAAQQYVARLAHKYGKAKALSILAHKVARAVYFMLSRGHAFDAAKFFPIAARSERPGPAPAPTAPTTPGAATRGRRAVRANDAPRSGPPRRVREGGGYLSTPQIDRSSDESPLATEGVSMLSTVD
jgi:hypothetical protein